MAVFNDNFQCIMALEDNLEALYDVDFRTNEFHIISRGDFYRTTVEDKLLNTGDFFESLKDNIVRVIHPDDITGIREVFDKETIRSRLLNNERIEYYYRATQNQDLPPVWFKLRIVFKDAARSNIIVGVFNANEELRAKQIEDQLETIKELSSFTSFFLGTYVSAYYVNLRDMSFKVFKRTEQLDRNYPLEGDYFESLKSYILHEVHPEDRDELLRDLKPDRIRKILNEQSDYTRKYRDISDGVEKIYRLQVIRGGDENHAAFGFIDVTEETRKDEEQQRKHLLGAIPLSPDILTKANIGLWSFELDEGKAPRMYVDEAMLGLIGLEHQLAPEETYHAWYDHIDEGSYGLVSEAVTKMINGEHAEVQYPWHHPDGRTFIVRCGGVRNPEYTDGIRIEGTHQNVTEVLHYDEEQYRMERELADRQRRLKAFSDMINAALWSIRISVSGEIESIEWSDEFRKMLGFENTSDFPDILESWSDRLHPEDRTRSMELLRNSISNDAGILTYDIKYRLKRKTGEYVWYHAVGRIRINGNGSRELFGIIMDISSDVKLEEALSMAQSANRAKTTFLNNMSHDIRTPMNAIIGYSELAALHIDDKESVKAYLSKISQSSDHLLSLINDVLDMSRIESGKMTLNENPEHMSEIIRGACDIIRQEIDAKKLDFRINSGIISDELVVCDKLRLRQVLLNILSNAIKYTPDGGSVSLSVNETATGESGRSRFIFSVRDNGIGMSEKFLKNVFDPFTRAASSTISGIQGTGLGMSITKNIINLMGGSINIKSEQGKGTEVIFELEMAVQSGRPVQGGSSGRTDQPLDLSGKRILVVEDNELNREIATTILAEFGCDTSSANDGDEAVDRMKSANTGDFDLVIMDVQMPKMNGYEATRQIRALGTEISRIPIIAMTANAFEEDRKLALESGMNEHISKPFSIDELKKILQKFLG